MPLRSSCWLLVPALLLLASATQAQIVTYSFEGDVSTPTTTASNATASTFVLGAGLTNANTTGYVTGSPGRARTAMAFAGTTTVPGTQAQAISGNDYVEFSLTAGAGFELDLSSLAVDLQRSSTGPASLELRTSVDNYAAAVGQVVAVPTAFGTFTISLSNAVFQSLPSITFRLYGYGATSATGTIRFDDVTVNGAVVPIGQTQVTQTLDDVAGYRLLSAPVQNVTVDALADVNLVQGIAGNTTAPGEAQYPAAPPNFFTRYNDPTAPAGDVFGAYARPASTSETVEPGRGFFWQFYDQRINPSDTGSGGGTSESYELPARQLVATGPAITADHEVRFTTATSDRFYMIGNPFARPLTVSAITVAGGIQGDVFQAFRPLSRTSGEYVLLFRTGTMGQTAADVWQGFFAQTVDPAAPTFLFDADLATPAAPDFIGRPAISGSVQILLAGATESGIATSDGAALIRFAEGATPGWDALDASKMTPPSETYALIAPVLDRDGVATRVAISALPSGLTEALVPLAFTATHAGTYTLAADLSGLPEGWTAELRDAVTGTVVDLADGYTFASDATAWTDRFALALRASGTTASDPAPTTERTLTAPAPNPATGRTALTLRLPSAERVTATVVDALGRTVATVYDGEAPAATDVVLAVDASRLAPGVYVVRVQGATFAESRRLTVVR